MKFCDERIQNHLLNGGKIKNNTFEGSYVIYIGNNSIIKKDNGEYYTIKGQDLYSDKWEIVESEYDWDKIIKDKILCVFSDYIDYRTYVISPLIKVEDNNFSFKTIDELSYGHCKPFNPADFNIAKDLNEYEK